MESLGKKSVSGVGLEALQLHPLGGHSLSVDVTVQLLTPSCSYDELRLSRTAGELNSSSLTLILSGCWEISRDTGLLPC